jgi:hypothetical protein
MKLPNLPLARIVVMVPEGLAGNKRDDGSVVTESPFTSEFMVPLLGDTEFDLGMTTVRGDSEPRPQLLEHGVAVSAWYQPRGWQDGKHYNEPTWRFFDETGEEVTWDQFLDRYCERYPDVNRPDWPFRP